MSCLVIRLEMALRRTRHQEVSISNTLIDAVVPPTISRVPSGAHRIELPVASYSSMLPNSRPVEVSQIWMALALVATYAFG